MKSKGLPILGAAAWPLGWFARPGGDRRSTGDFGPDGAPGDQHTRGAAIIGL